MNTATTPWQALVAIGLAAACIPAQADDYRVQLDLAGMRTDADMKTKLERDSIVATGYLNAVQTVDSIIGESAFLNKASFVSVSFVDGQIEQPGNKVDGDGWGINAKYVANERMIYEASYSTEDIAGVDNPSWGLGVGFYIDDLTTFGINFSESDPDNNPGDAFRTFAINLKSVVDVSDDDRASGEATLSVTQNAIANTILQLDSRFDYYFTPRLSVGGRIGLIGPNNGDDENLYGLQTRYFVNNNFAVEAAVSTTVFQEDSDTASVDRTDTFSIRLTGRL